MRFNYREMRLAGRINLSLIVVLAVVAIVVAILVSTPKTPAYAASQFMAALAKGDAKQLTELSYLGKDPAEEVQRKWEKTLDLTKYYRFTFQMGDTFNASDKNATVKVLVAQNVNKPGYYLQPFELPMVQENGNWKVDVRGISRSMYPALPR